ncbi:GtrA family protein [Pseudoxanthobacter sp.]|uniref:GtrA family protein n=1 Tax=Pseudoxanthobacter sp. TaxID=1925742 RepID=UPI002FE1656C
MNSQFLRFAIAGTLGFVADAGMLYLMMALGLGRFSGRLVSFVFAVWVTWQFNRRFTFRQRRDISALREFAEYFVAMLGGGAVNYAAYSVTVLLLPDSTFVPLVGVAMGALAGMVVNFITAKWLVFRS